MSQTSGHMLGLVELAETPPLAGLEKSYFDQVMQAAFEERMKDWVRPKDKIQALPDNRICVLLSGVTSAGELELAAAKLKRVFFEPHYHMGKSVPMAVTVGFAPYDGNGKTMSTAVQNAAQALSRAKSSSRLFEIYSNTRANDERDQRQLLQRMAEALERGEFQLYYQPKVHAAFNNLVGAEALIRWHTSDGQVIFPDSFIELAEQNDIIKPLSWWIIKSAVAHLSRWPEPLSVAVNVSPVLLLDNEIISVVLDALDIYSLEPSRLTLEVTETIMIEDQGLMLETLAALRSHGVRIAIDDFGTGFSSLSYFRDLPADEIKIDKSFVQNMLVSKKDRAIVKAVIDLAHNFSLKVVAEGVESAEIAARLSELQCDILQGYVYDKPLPADEFETNYKLR